MRKNTPARQFGAESLGYGGPLPPPRSAVRFTHLAADAPPPRTMAKVVSGAGTSLLPWRLGVEPECCRASYVAVSSARRTGRPSGTRVQRLRRPSSCVQLFMVFVSRVHPSLDILAFIPVDQGSDLVDGSVEAPSFDSLMPGFDLAVSQQPAGVLELLHHEPHRSPAPLGAPDAHGADDRVGRPGIGPTLLLDADRDRQRVLGIQRTCYDGLADPPPATPCEPAP